jgi:hypothetical protein
MGRSFRWGKQLKRRKHHSGGARNEPGFTHEYFPLKSALFLASLASQLSTIITQLSVITVREAARFFIICVVSILRTTG